MGNPTIKSNPLREACAEIMADRTITGRYPEGINATEILHEIRATGRGEFPLCTWLDVHDEMTAIYGDPR